MESWQHSSFEENVDLDTIVLSSSDIYSSTGVQESNSGIKEEQFEDITDIIDISADNDVKTEKVKLMEEKSAINRIEFPKGHMKSECIYEIIDFPKYHQKNLIDFCPERLFRLVMLCTHQSRVLLRIIKTSHMYLVFKTFQARNLSNFFGAILENL